MLVTFVVIQSVGAVLLAILALFPALQNPDGGLNRKGMILLIVGVTLNLGGTGMMAALNSRAEAKISILLESIANTAMKTPKASSQAPLPTASRSITITDPADGSSVGESASVQGNVVKELRSNSIWLVVHPVDTSSYWIQGSGLVSAGKSWVVGGTFGRAGDIDVGKRFEVLAVADPDQPLTVGTIFDAWPKAQEISNVITLVRK